MFLQGGVVGVWLIYVMAWLAMAAAFLAVLYWIIRLAVRHALRDTVEAGATRPLPGGERAEP